MWLGATLFGFVNFAVNYLNENKYKILSEINPFIWFHCPIRFVNYWMLPGSRQNTLI